ncbi:MAG TPA: ribose ABC transporter permease [Lachnospiraceae bacterium]|nr:ribose ABC transporter permease [Lachnospiraceae bacterium]
MNNTKSIIKQNAIWVVFFCMVIIFTIANPTFIKPSNLVAILRQVAVYGIASVGMTFVILIAGIDLSAGSVITFVNIITALLMVKAGINMWIAALIGVAMATLVGVLNGFMVASIGIPAIIATFSTQTIFQGISYLISGGMPVTGFDDNFGIFGKATIGIIPVSAIIMIVCFGIGSFILNKSYFGRYFYAIGGSEEAAELSGIRVNRTKYLIYAFSGFFSGLAGIVMLSRTGSAQNTAGLGYEFDVITCVVLGGVSVNGGIGKISGVVAGVLIIGSLTNGMILMNVSSYMQQVIKGLVLAIAVGIDCLSKKRQAV